GSESAEKWNSRGHFISAAAEAMRRILIENARRKKTDKRGGQLKRIDLSQAEPMAEAEPTAVLEFDEALTSLSQEEAIAAEWDRTDLSFQVRLDNLLSGTGSTNPLNKVNGQLILLTPATNPRSSNGTVHADGVRNTLIGTNAINPATTRRAHNGFFYDDGLDVLVNFLSSSDRKHKVS